MTCSLWSAEHELKYRKCGQITDETQPQWVSFILENTGHLSDEALAAEPRPTLNQGEILTSNATKIACEGRLQGHKLSVQVCQLTDRPMTHHTLYHAQTQTTTHYHTYLNLSMPIYHFLSQGVDRAALDEEISPSAKHIHAASETGGHRIKAGGRASKKKIQGRHSEPHKESERERKREERQSKRAVIRFHLKY